MTISGLAFANEGGGGGGGAGGMVKMDSMVINLKGGSYISFTAQLKLNDPADETVLKDYMPMVRFEFIKAMVGQDGSVVRTPEFMSSFADNAVKFINKALHGDYIKDVFFTDWMIQ
jgi:flagellar basal body-associated protein FliL